ncbi:6686_t:CDS:10, partial [Ambispora leptoticha]
MQQHKKNIYLTGEGRFPWYRPDGKSFEPYLIGVAGGSASGKTAVSERIIKNLNAPWVVLLSMDSFYKPLTPEQKIAAYKNDHNFDHPNSFDYDLLLETLQNLKEGRRVEIPMYDFVTHSRFLSTQMQILDSLVDRDINERGRDLHGVLQQYTRFVKPSYDDFIHPTVKNAHVRQLHERKLSFRWELAKIECSAEVPANVILLKETPQLKGIHTIIRDHTTQRDDFIFYAERLATLVVERGLEELPFKNVEATTPLNINYLGKQLDAQLCGVSILRAGATMENGLRRVHKDALIGKILIQSNPSTGEPQLHFLKLPNNISRCYVLLMDAQIATGAAGLMAIRVLLDHDVPEERIIFLTFLASPQGLHAIANAFPKVKVCTSMVDPKINENTLYIEPGMGNFG